MINFVFKGLYNFLSRCFVNIFIYISILQIFFEDEWRKLTIYIVACVYNGLKVHDEDFSINIDFTYYLRNFVSSCKYLFRIWEIHFLGVLIDLLFYDLCDFLLDFLVHLQTRWISLDLNDFYCFSPIRTVLILKRIVRDC